MLRYKLQIFGIPIEGPTNVFCDNRGVVWNSSRPESNLQNKHNVINYHVVREAAVAGIMRVGKEDGTRNLTDLLTKVLMGKKRWDLCYSIIWQFGLGTVLGVRFLSDINVHHLSSQHKWLIPGTTKVGDWFLQIYVTSKRWAQH